MKVGVPSEEFELLVENLQALLRDVIRRDVVDGNLQPLQAGFV